jgi:hypothetical protein
MTRVPTSRGRCAAHDAGAGAGADEDLSLLSVPPPFGAAPAPLHAAPPVPPAAEPFSGAVDASSMEPISSSVGAQLLEQKPRCGRFGRDWAFRTVWAFLYFFP